MSAPAESFTLSFPNGHSVEFPRKRASLYTFVGELSIYNHVFLELPLEDSKLAGMGPAVGEVDEDGLVGCYIFSFSPHHSPLSTLMRENDFPLFLNMLEVRDFEKDAYKDQEYLHLEGLLGNLPDAM